jgi:hypothetical protein
MTTTIELPHPPGPVYDGWLRECHGFRVDSPGGRVGIVADVLIDEHERVRALRVAAGRIGRRMLLIDAADVARIVPHERRLRLASHVTPLATHP